MGIIKAAKLAFDYLRYGEEGEEPDPLEEMLNKKEKTAAQKEEEERPTETAFCPYCGAKAEKDYAFCRSCGKKL